MPKIMDFNETNNLNSKQILSSSNRNAMDTIKQVSFHDTFCYYINFFKH